MRGHRRHGRVSRNTPARRSTTPRRCIAMAAVAAIHRKAELPNYKVFDEKRYFHAGSAAHGGGVQGLPDRAAGLRGHLGAASRRSSHARDRRRAAGRHQCLALRAAQATRARACRARAHARMSACRWRMSTWSAARTSWCSTATRSSWMPRARSSCARRPSRKAPTWSSSSAQGGHGRAGAGRRRAGTERRGHRLPGAGAGGARLRQQARLSRAS